MGYDPSTNSIISVFRGSSEWKNLIQDIDIIKTDYKRDGCNKCSVHKGFYDDYESVAASVNSYAYNLHQMYPSATVIVTGHSLGAAMA